MERIVMNFDKIKDTLGELIDRDANDSVLPKNRLKFLFLSIFIIFFILTGKLIYLSLKDNKSTFALKDEVGNLKRRNSIVDRNGVIVASDINLVNFYINRDLIGNPRRAAKTIHKIIPEIDEERLYKKLISTKNRAKYILIKKNITPKQQIAIKESGILGFEFENTIGRVYPHKNLFSHVVGYVDIDRNGIAGLEQQHNDYLKNPNNPPLEMTLDIRVQSVLRQQLLKAMEKYNAKSIIGIISEIKTGNIIAIASLPDFDPNQPNLSPQSYLYNRATYGVYEMGSVFKMFTIALALDKNIITEEKKYDISQVIPYGNYKIKQDNYTKRFLTPEEILVYSSNVGTALIGLEIGSERMKNFLSLIGMFDRIPANFPSLAEPLIPKVWRDINTITVSYGHGIAITPLHVVMAAAGITNSGVMKIPRFVKSDQFDDTKIIGDRTSKIMNLYLRNVVRNGTGWRANSLGYSVGGKTGSARLLRNGEYMEDNILANFVGIFPMNNPSYLIYVMVESPSTEDMKNGISASNVAAPVFARIIENVAPILNVVPYVNRE